MNQCSECQITFVDRSYLINGRCFACTEKRRCNCGHLLDSHKPNCIASAQSRLGFRLGCECKAYHKTIVSKHSHWV